MLSCYEAPYFDATDKSVLRIDTKQGKEAPPGATEIIVTIDSQIACKLENSLVNLSGDYEWAYYTNGRIDNDAPEFITSGTDNFTVLFASKDQDEDVSTKKLLSEFENIDDSEYVANNLTSNTIWVKGGFSDAGSGPNSLKWSLYKVNDRHYPAAETKIEDGQINDLEITGQNAAVKTKSIGKGKDDDEGTAVLLPLKDEDEGLYRIDFTCYDKNEKSSAPTSYYFVHDMVSKKQNVTNLGNTRNSADKETVKWKNHTDWDFDHVIVERWLENERMETFEKTKDAVSQNFGEDEDKKLENQKRYEYRFYNVDIFGNKSPEYTAWSDKTGPSTYASSMSGSRKTYDRETVKWNSNPSGSDVSHVVIRQYDKTSGKLTGKTFTQNSSSTKTYEFTGLANQHKYEYRFYSVDYAGNESSSYSSYYDNTAPSLLSGTYTGVRHGIVDVYLNTPSNEDFDHVEYSTSSNSGFKTVDFNDKTNVLGTSKHLKKTFRNAKSGTKYGYYLRTVDYAGNASGTTYVTETGGVTAGDFCYYTSNDGLFCSENYYDDKELAGIVALTGNYYGIAARNENCKDDDSIVRIITPNFDQTKKLVHTKDYNKNYPYGSDGGGSYDTNREGYQTYQAIIKNTNALNASPMYQYLKNTYNKNSRVTWYLPAVNELLMIKYGEITREYSSKASSIDGAYKTLYSKGKANISSFSNPETSVHDGEIVSSTVLNDCQETYTVYFRSNKRSYYIFKIKDHQDLMVRSLYLARIDMSDTENPKKW